MLKWLLLSFLFFFSLALEISMDSARDDFIKYSTLHLSDKEKFLCQEIKDDFSVATEVICAFSKKPSKHIKKLQNEFFKVNTFIKKDTYFLTIKPYYKIKLIAEIFDLTKDDTVYKFPKKVFTPESS